MTENRVVQIDAEADRAVAFDAFYRAEWGRLAGTLRLVAGDAGAADEVAQEAFVRVWMRWDRVSAMERPAGWLYVTAFRLLRRRLGRERRRPVPEAMGTTPAVEIGDRVVLDAALASLPVRQREAVVARHVLGYSGPDAAALLGMKPDAFRQLLSRALRDLRVSPALIDLAEEA